MKHKLLIVTVVFFLTLSGFAFADGVLVLRPSGQSFDELVTGLKDEIDGEISVTEKLVEKESTVEDLVKIISKTQPQVIVVAENRIIKLYEAWQKQSPSKSSVPVVFVAALFINEYVGKVANSTGVLYEIPAVTSVINLQALTQGKIKRVGVLHRKRFADTISDNKNFLSKVGVDLFAIELPNDAGEGDIKKGLKKLKKRGVDALWVTNDSALLAPKVLLGTWIPFMKTYKKNVIVGVETLLLTKFNFGSFAVFPDMGGLGVQAAGIIFDLADNDWQADGRAHQPISVKKAINLDITRKRGIAIQSDQIGRLDKIIE